MIVVVLVQWVLLA